MRKAGRVILYIISIWIMVLFTILVLHWVEQPKLIPPDVSKQIEEIHRWCESALAPAGN